MLEIYETGEAWLPVGDDFEFSYISIVFKNLSTGELFYTQTKQRYKPHEKPDPDKLELIPIPLDDVWPLAILTISSKPRIRSPRTVMSNVSAYSDTKNFDIDISLAIC